MEGFDFVETVSGKTDGKFAGNGRMITVEDAVYAEAASALLEAIGDGYYYNGTVEVDGDGFYSTLTATLIVYRDKEALPEGGAVYPVSDLVPVWWEFATVVPGWGEVLNDFSFLRLRDAVLARG